MKTTRIFLVCLVLLTIALLMFQSADARKPIRNAFFSVYSSATGTQLDDLPSDTGHCGVCHYDFSGAGARNSYGLAVEVARNSGLYAGDEEAIQSIELVDSDGDGYSNLIEITSAIFTNTPTFPGLTISDTSLISEIPVSEVVPYVTPEGSNDSIPPVVTVMSPNGAESYDANSLQSVTWVATDANGISDVKIQLSDDGGTTFKPIAVNELNDSSFTWFVPNLPGANSIIQVVARDGGGNLGSDVSDATFTINQAPAGFVGTTLRDMDLGGSQPFSGNELEDPDVNCVTCHANYDAAVEPWYNWKGSMMGQAMRDPLFLACLAVAEQDAPSVGDLCLRCHTPGGWLGGRSVDTGGGLLNDTDFQGVQCDFCHRLVDPVYSPGISPPQDSTVLAGLASIPPAHANGQFVVDPNPIRRGPYTDAAASHAFLGTTFQQESNMCGTCHDVSNPVFVHTGGDDYAPNGMDAPHPDGDLRNMFPIERTFSEWSVSEFATSGVYLPQFAGNLPGGIVGSCQDCHMRDVSGKGCNEPGAPTRPDLGLHDLTGGNYFIPDILPDFYPGEVDTARLQAGKQRAINMLQLAASMALEAGQVGTQPTVKVTITNETGHKLPSGYPEGRRIWINVKAYDDVDALVYESGAYDEATGVLTKDADIKVYEIKPGLSPALAGALGLPAGESFHFVLNDTVLSDNRIPPRGFTNANFDLIQSGAVAYTYADSQYWDETEYVLPSNAVFVEVELYYQSTTKEYVEFLRDENVTNSAGDDLYNAWVAHGKAAPVTMVEDTITVSVEPTGIGEKSNAITAMWDNFPNPFNPTTTIKYSLAERQHVSIKVFDVAGRLVTTLVNDTRPAGVQRVVWNGRNADEQPVASGVYFIRMVSGNKEFVRRAVMLK